MGEAPPPIVQDQFEHTIHVRNFEAGVICALQKSHCFKFFLLRQEHVIEADDHCHISASCLSSRCTLQLSYATNWPASYISTPPYKQGAFLCTVPPPCQVLLPTFDVCASVWQAHSPKMIHTKAGKACLEVYIHVSSGNTLPSCFRKVLMCGSSIVNSSCTSDALEDNTLA